MKVIKLIASTTLSFIKSIRRWNWFVFVNIFVVSLVLSFLLNHRDLPSALANTICFGLLGGLYAAYEFRSE